jgi:hypothetical protein
MKKDPNAAQQQQDPANFERTTQTRPDVIKTFDTVASELAGVAGRAGGWAKEQVFNGLQDFVSRVLYGEKAPEQEKDKEQEIDKGLDR